MSKGATGKGRFAFPEFGKKRGRGAEAERMKRLEKVDAGPKRADLGEICRREPAKRLERAKPAGMGEEPFVGEGRSGRVLQAQRGDFEAKTRFRG